MANLVHRQVRADQRQQVVETLVHNQHLAELRAKLAPLPGNLIARVLETLALEDSVAIWDLLSPKRASEVRSHLSEALALALTGSAVRNSDGTAPQRVPGVNAFAPEKGKLRQIQVCRESDLATIEPVWVDMLAPTATERQWVANVFQLRLPETDELTDIEESARFYVDDDGAVHLHSDFLLDHHSGSRNVPVAFILRGDTLFSLRAEELPVFRLQRLRARIEPGSSAAGADLLLDLYAADIESSAQALEGAYAQLEAVGRGVLSMQTGDDEAATLLAEIARQEDLNSRIRRNVQDTRRALSFLLRGRILKREQSDDAQQMLRDIDSLDGHTAFLFGKINFLMDAIVGFTNISQNKRVSRLTVLSVVFVPINIIAGIGGMSEFSMMTRDLQWPVAYGSFVAALCVIGFLTYRFLRWSESRQQRPAQTRAKFSGPAISVATPRSD